MSDDLDVFIKSLDDQNVPKDQQPAAIKEWMRDNPRWDSKDTYEEDLAKFVKGLDDDHVPKELHCQLIEEWFRDREECTTRTIVGDTIYEILDYKKLYELNVAKAEKIQEESKRLEAETESLKAEIERRSERRRLKSCV